MSATVLLGTVAIEPTRWGDAAPAGSDRGAPTAAPITLSSWMDPIAAAGFDGIEVWERHLTAAEPDEAARVIGHPLSIDVFNSYVSLDDPSDAGRSTVTGWVRRTGSTGVKFNVGNDPAAQGAYAERISAWLEELPPTVVLLCECHHGISIAEDPVIAAAIFDAAGRAECLQAIVHTHEDPDHIRARFDSYGDRITHVHVNFLDVATLSTPRLREIRGRVESQVALLRSLGFDGSWTIEFSHGVMTEHDEPASLLEQAADDLHLLREVLA